MAGTAGEMSAMPKASKTPHAKAPIKAGDHLILVDGSGFIFRAFHALPPLTRKSDALPVGAVAGFCNMIWKMLQEGPSPEKGDEPTHFAVIFDYSARTFRRDIYADYKAHRPEPPSDLIPQFGLIRQATRAFNLACLEQEGWEADDLIATYTKQATGAGATVTIVSSDKDLMQIIKPGVAMVDTMKNVVIDREAVKEKFGVYPEKMIELQALVGDFDRQRTGCARHRPEDGGAAPRRIRRPRNAAFTGRRDQTAEAAREPDRVCGTGAHLPQARDALPRRAARRAAQRPRG